MIDVDECGIQLTHVDRGYGRAPRGKRAQMPGHVRVLPITDFFNPLLLCTHTHVHVRCAKRTDI